MDIAAEMVKITYQRAVVEEATKRYNDAHEVTQKAVREEESAYDSLTNEYEILNRLVERVGTVA